MNFTQEHTEDGGVIRRSFELGVAGETVPGVIWAPEAAKGPRPLMLMGHGGSQHKRTTALASQARKFARKFGYATLAIDAPGHGDRIARAEAASLARQVATRMRSDTPVVMTPEILQAIGDRTRKALPEWKAALDAVQALDFVGAGGPVGYWGLSMGTAIGVPFVAAEPRITAAVFGLSAMRGGAANLEADAKAISIPIQFIFQWDDVVAPREAGIALFNAFGSAEKTMHINPGGHLDIPDFEVGDWEAFFLRHLGTAEAPANACAKAAA